MEKDLGVKRGKTIRLNLETIKRLDRARHQGQSYDGIVAELIDLYESNEGEVSEGKYKKERIG